MPSRKSALIIILFLIVIVSSLYYSGALSTVTKNFSKSEPTYCTLVGCGSNSSIFFDAPLSFEELKKSRVQFCQNFKCATITFDNIKEIPRPYTGWGGTSDNEDVRADIAADKNGKLFIGLSFQNRGFFGKSIDRDRYSVAVINSEGKEVLNFNKWMSYKTFYPNGRACGPACYSSVLDNREETILWD